MEIKTLTSLDIPQVVQLARQNFFECIKPFLNDVGMMQAFYEYVDENHLTQLMNQRQLYIWGAYENGQLVGGKVLDPESGKFYYGKIYLDGGKLVLRGSLDKRGFLGRNQTWLPAK